MTLSQPENTPHAWAQTTGASSRKGQMTSSSLKGRQGLGGRESLTCPRRALPVVQRGHCWGRARGGPAFSPRLPATRHLAWHVGCFIHVC